MPDATPSNPDDEFVRALTESQTALRGYCRASLGHGEEAKEALQRTNIVLWKKSGDWDRGTEFLKWAVAVAKFEVLGVIRDRQRNSREGQAISPGLRRWMAEIWQTKYRNGET